MIRFVLKRFIWVLTIFTFLECSEKKSGENHLFQEMDASETGIAFENTITNTDEFNIFNYRNFYNGGGVAIGDINNDNLPDIYLIANQGENKLFLNKGNFKFEDITGKAGVAGTKSWSTGATFADVNGDGLLDLYVCNAGRSDERANELFINKGNGTFAEKAKEYGLDDQGYSTHAAFFDFDRDGDLDMFLLNNSFTPVGRLGYANLRSQRDKEGGHKLFRNDGERFTDISETAGIYGSIIGFGLGITIGDVNNDNWLDMYISNDFYEHDYLYINNHDGTFKESIKSAMQHTSLSSMGADIADINNDGKLDIYVTDMLPGSDRRLKLTSTFEGHDLQELKVSRDFHYQYMQNTLQLNQSGAPDGKTWFSEIARFTGTHATDWSWGALIFDMDSDGEKDIFVANAINKDLTNQDFVSFLADPSNIAEVSRTRKFDYKLFLDKMPSEPLANYAFKNNGNLSFANKAEEWGLATPSFSNGAAYGDLDNDGDLDLIVNNVNSQLFVYKNKSSERKDFHYIKFKLNGEQGNKDAIGAKIYVHQKARTQMLQQMPNRGFESSVDLRLVFGLGKHAEIDSVTILWPNDKQRVMKAVKADSMYVVSQKDAQASWKLESEKGKAKFAEITAASGIDFMHKEADYVDYNQNPLIKQMYSRFGPALAVGDVNKDGLDDVYIGGAVGQGGKLYIQKKDGAFLDKTPKVFAEEAELEASDAVFFDADNDQDLDLLVVSGSNEFKDDDVILLPRLYLNDGKAGFTKSNGFPGLKVNASCIAAADYDKDGDIDVFIGSRLKAGQYGIDPPSYLFTNDGTGNFKNYTKRFMPQVEQLGMVTDATWADLDGDAYPELIVVGDWMPVMIFKNKRNKLELQSTDIIKNAKGEIEKTNGWWNTVAVSDIDHDGDLDIVAGNLGLNSRLRATQEKPVEMYVKDFDRNGVLKQIITCPDETGISYPMVMKPDLLRAMPSLKKKFVKYEQYAGKTIEEVIDKADLADAVVKKVYTAESAVLRNDGKGAVFTFMPLSAQAQLSPVFSIIPTDYDHDGSVDLIVSGNYYDVLPEIGRYDALKGLILRGTKTGFEAKSPSETGFWAEDQVRTMKQLKQGQIILGRNNTKVQVYKPVPHK
ncbi:VCBS repeat-containing protein [Dyadobacter sp. LHD-138]|uniref:VCBS repeat-containing protein n=1 Tax=Dyadobacter sp. LHD-138 TaxID=3071413 RepID=UPI0027DF8664|nr:VCBS repeat-containing protein [Dyadobacter sp. LHD-138]MDQ6481864.1 VCBS repeat-containing protein [Dyadobacter sp. LHD-138]